MGTLYGFANQFTRPDARNDINQAVIAWLYIDYLFQRKTSPFALGLTFPAGYIILYFLGWTESAAINVFGFFIVNWLLLGNYHCKVSSAIFHSAFLTSSMAITESVAALCISTFNFSFDDEINNLSVLIVMTVISKFVYFALTVIASVFFTRNKSQQADPSLTSLLCCLPILSAGISAVVIYIGAYAEMNAPVKILMLTIVLTLLAVHLIFMVLYNKLSKLHADHLTMQLSLQREEADTAYYQALQE